jgi:hypothetical protein
MRREHLTSGSNLKMNRSACELEDHCPIVDVWSGEGTGSGITSRRSRGLSLAVETTNETPRSVETCQSGEYTFEVDFPGCSQPTFSIQLPQLQIDGAAADVDPVVFTPENRRILFSPPIA